MFEVDPDKLLDALSDDTLVDLAASLPEAMQQRGLELPAALGNRAVSTEVSVSEIDERTDLAVDTLNSLGLIADKSEAREVIAPQVEAFYQATVGREDNEHPDSFATTDLSRKIPLSTLITAFDKKQGASTSVYSGLWDQYGVADLNNRNANLPTPAQIGKLPIRVLGMLTGERDHADEDGLYYTGQNLGDQKNSIEGALHANNSVQSIVTMGVFNPADYIMLNAQRRETGEPLLDRMTFTRFPQMEMKAVDGISYVPYACSDGGRLVLYGSYGYADSYDGVRLSVGQAK